jgi:protease PrsW
MRDIPVRLNPRWTFKGRGTALLPKGRCFDCATLNSGPRIWPLTMAGEDLLTLGGILIGLAFLPPLFYLIYIRNVERFQREPWSAIFQAFLFGAIVSVIFAVILEFTLKPQLREYSIPQTDLTLPVAVLLVVVLAPLVEEFTKGLGVVTVKRNILEIEDGIVYGAAVGLGFSATENLFYELQALQQHQDYTFVAVAGVRSITSSFLHATASGILGYGIAKRKLERGMLFEVLPFYVLAVLLHAAFNGLATFLSIDEVPVWGVLAVFVFSFAGIRWTIGRIRRLDQQGRPRAYR